LEILGMKGRKKSGKADKCQSTRRRTRSRIAASKLNEFPVQYDLHGRMAVLFRNAPPVVMAYVSALIDDAPKAALALNNLRRNEHHVLVIAEQKRFPTTEDVTRLRAATAAWIELSTIIKKHAGDGDMDAVAPIGPILRRALCHVAQWANVVAERLFDEAATSDGLEWDRLFAAASLGKPAPATDDRAITNDVAPMRPSADFRTCRWGRSEFTFTPNQSQIVKLLYRVWENGGGRVGKDYLLSESNINADRIDKVFYELVSGKRRRHPAWGTMIRSDGRGLYWLVPPGADLKITGEIRKSP
jgi:hypothetical protein